MSDPVPATLLYTSSSSSAALSSSSFSSSSSSLLGWLDPCADGNADRIGGWFRPRDGCWTFQRGHTFWSAWSWWWSLTKWWSEYDECANDKISPDDLWMWWPISSPCDERVGGWLSWNTSLANDNLPPQSDILLIIFLVLVIDHLDGNRYCQATKSLLGTFPEGEDKIMQLPCT